MELSNPALLKDLCWLMKTKLDLQPHSQLHISGFKVQFFFQLEALCVRRVALFHWSLLDQRDVNQQISATCWHLIQVTRNEEPLCTAVQTPRRLFKSSALYIAFALCKHSPRTMSYFQSYEQLHEDINLFLIVDFTWISLSMLMHCRAVDACFHMFSIIIIIMLLSEH